MIIKRIDPKSLAKMSAAVGGILGIPYGLWAAAMVVYVGQIAPKELNVPKDGVFAVAMAAGVFTPILMIVGGVIYGFLAALLYNWLASWAGGIRFEIVLSESSRTLLREAITPAASGPAGT
jgi:hypothetical protein